VKFGIFAPYAVDPAQRVPRLEEGPDARAFAQMVEELGFESLWVVEHSAMFERYASRYPYAPAFQPYGAHVPQPDPLVWLAYAAAATTRLRLGTGVLILPQRQPVALAKAAASLDRLSGGRLLLGVGVGWLREESAALGIDFDERGARADEYIEVLRALWREPAASYAGRFVRFQGAVCEPRPAQAGGVPILVGGHSAAAARRAGRLGDGFFPLGASLERLQELHALAREAARGAGRDPEALEVTCLGALDADGARAWRDAGVERLIVSPPATDLTGMRAALERFRREAMEPLAAERATPRRLDS
jgi:probable F420-dependent oxidoreductase